MSTMYNPILIYVTLAGIVLILLVTAFSMIVEMYGRYKVNKLKKLLEHERIMSNISMAETENEYLEGYDNFLDLVNSIVPEQQDIKNRILSYMQESGNHNHVEDVKCCAHPGDPLKWWQIRYLIMRDERSANVGAILISIDERKQLEQELASLQAQLDKRMEANQMYRALSSIIYIPINAVVNACNKIVLAGKDIKSEFKETQLEIANRHFRNITKSINDFRNYVDIDTKTIKLNPEEISVKEFMEALFFKEKTFVQKDGSMFFLVPGREDAIIKADREALRLVLLQLLDNARKFTDHGNIAIGWKARFNPASVEIFVEDSGIGLKSEDMDNIFIPGWMASIYYAGNGIGLPIAKTFTEAMGGTINCESQLGIGSRFYLTFNTID